MPLDINFRHARNEDLDAIYHIEINTHIIPWSKKILQDCLRVGYDFQVISKQYQIIGYAITRQKDSVAHILNICIDKPFQSQGFGRMLLQQVIDCCKAHREIHQITLEVRPSNKKALQLYQSLAFESVELKAGYYTVGEQQEDALVLVKHLS